jgi:DNA primase
MNILELLESYGIKLLKAGKNFKALCPFHKETEPSFYIYPETSSYFCFGCSSGGGAVHFVARYLNIPYRAAEKLIGCAQTSDATVAQRLKILKEQAPSIKTLQLEVSVLLHSLYGKKFLSQDKLVQICKYLDDNFSEGTLWHVRTGLQHLAFRETPRAV